MRNYQVRESLRKKLNRHFGFEEQEQQEEIDYKGIVKEMKEIEKEMKDISNKLETKEENLRAEIIKKGEQARANAKGDIELQLANNKFAKEFLRIGLTLRQDPEYVQLANQYRELGNRYKTLAYKKQKFEFENADLLEEIRREKIKEQLRSIDLID